MKSKKNRSLVAAVVMFFCGAAFGVICSNTPTSAQMQADAPPPGAAAPIPAPGPVGRYQISAYSANSSYGCYLLDTASGEMWITQQGGKMRVVRK